jgi:hypothetical protein
MEDVQRTLKEAKECLAQAKRFDYRCRVLNQADRKGNRQDQQEHGDCFQQTRQGGPGCYPSLDQRLFITQVTALN